ncbi:HU family DNA-binding protein [Wolbachia endosymbiont of Ctenocephalides felis wCfeT]|uniref:HU family DNA-binding protein n=1 Tax=Wolbachia endosymbiont of Ctenocephalides felis wCfeT TaxID=2732593 RepID=UPI001444D9FB|nr:HU family DNA-binding protein [Wolbachia endosymbiont of Ctenocephalides felis wCfeT]
MTKVCGKAHIVDEVAKRLSIKKATIDEMYDAILDVAEQALLGGYRLSLQGIGSLKTVERAARKTYNPYAKKIMTIPKRKAVKFSISDTLKKSLN